MTVEIAVEVTVAVPPPCVTVTVVAGEITVVVDSEPGRVTVEVPPTVTVDTIVEPGRVTVEAPPSLTVFVDVTVIAGRVTVVAPPPPPSTVVVAVTVAPGRVEMTVVVGEHGWTSVLGGQEEGPPLVTVLVKVNVGEPDPVGQVPGRVLVMVRVLVAHGPVGWVGPTSDEPGQVEMVTVEPVQPGPTAVVPLPDAP